MDVQCIMRIMDASFRTRRTIEHSLHEIDRRALNAMVLVKRHGNKLASYGVVAQAFREQAGHLKASASPLQQSIAPLVRVQMRILQHRRYTDLFRRAAESMGEARAPTASSASQKKIGNAISTAKMRRGSPSCGGWWRPWCGYKRASRSRNTW